MHRGRETVVDIHSPTWKMISKCFECLHELYVLPWLGASYHGPEQPQSWSETSPLLITTFPVDSGQSTSLLSLSVTLPRYSLSFFVNEREELESRDFNNMVYDENQCVGTLFALQNILVFRPKTHIAGIPLPEGLIPRRILIPNGTPRGISGLEWQVRIDTGKAQPGQPLYHIYDVDIELGCLVGNGTLPNTRFLADLHAVSSVLEPDPLTGKTDVQAALSLLQSAGCRSIMKPKLIDFHPSWVSNHPQRPQVYAAYKEIQSRHYWDRSRLYPAVQRAAYRDSSNPNGSASPEDHKEDYMHDESGHMAFSITLGHLISNRGAPRLPARITLPRETCTTSSTDDIAALDHLFSHLRADPSFQREYLTHLNFSAQHLRMESRTTRTYKVTGENLIKTLKKYYVECRVVYLNSLEI
ncbi:hypothetical protein V8E55_005859 [Tylopilus felleus]